MADIVLSVSIGHIFCATLCYIFHSVYSKLLAAVLCIHMSGIASSVHKLGVGFDYGVSVALTQR